MVPPMCIMLLFQELDVLYFRLITRNKRMENTDAPNLKLIWPNMLTIGASVLSISLLVLFLAICCLHLGNALSAKVTGSSLLSAPKSKLSAPSDTLTQTCYQIYPNKGFDYLHQVLPTIDKTDTRYLFLARHGQTDKNKGGFLQGRGIDADLNQLGIDQAKELGHFLSYVKFDTVSSSTLVRAYQTASEVLRNNTVTQQSIPISQYEGLEEISWGDLEGKCCREEPWVSQFKNTVQRWSEGDADYRPPGGESPNEVSNRAITDLMEIMNQGGKYNLVISHGRTLRSLMYSVHGIITESVPNTAMYIFSWDGAKFSLVTTAQSPFS